METFNLVAIKMKEFLIIAFLIVNQFNGSYAVGDGSFFELDEQHDFQIPLRNTVESYKSNFRQNLVGKLLAIIKEQKPSRSENLNSIISAPELLAAKDILLDDQYKPWGAAALPSPNHNQVILDKVDDELFAPNSERHAYDERLIRHQDGLKKLITW